MNPSYKKLLNEYEKKRKQKVLEMEDRKNRIYSEIPELACIDSEINKLAISSAKSLLEKNDSNILNNLNEKISKLKKDKTNVLLKNNYPETYLNIKYDCDKCNDTGYIEINNSCCLCNCFKQKLFNIEYNKSNISNLQNQRFEDFISTYYSESVDNSKYNSDISPRKNIEFIKKICIEFIENFNILESKNLLFTGNTGLGKTFLSSCIANELIKNGKTVLYQTAPVMLDTIIDYRFGKCKDPTIYNSLLDVDLLIIDDLGTECINNMKFTELFNILNTRLLNQNNKITKTIISTNLSLQNLFNTYDERIVSRLVGNYNICRFFGDDIRFKKK
ncbi:MAG TPA: ATP-binding protein [Clostridia bacterium]|nr:ATP-binding protein [Clostridia bacterium]